MVEKKFYIEGEPADIFNVGFRPFLVAHGSEYGIRIHASNLRKQNKVRVIANGEVESIEAFYDDIKKTDGRMLKSKSEARYTFTDIEDYDGPEIDWNSYNLQFMSEQLTKGMIAANSILIDTKKEVTETKDQLTSIRSTLDTMYDKFGIIGNSLQRIEKKIPDINTPS